MTDLHIAAGRIFMRLKTSLRARVVTLYFPLVAFRPYSITVERRACSTPSAAIRANRLVPIKTRAAKNGISIFIGFIPSF